MNEKKIADLAYRLKRNKEEGKPGAVVFIGAGCSVTGGIPLAKGVLERLFEKFADAPALQGKSPKNTTYAEAMGLIESVDRKDLFREFVPGAKVNASHIYLASMIKAGFVDYVFTVNFDNLMLRALALFNEFPAVYDLATQQHFGTNTLDIGSVTYLHGMWNGLWQMNTEAELNHVIDQRGVGTVFRQTSLDRPWVVVGYSGQDLILDEIVGLKRFNHGLYWIGFKDNTPETPVVEKLLKPANMGAYLIKGHDSDAFFLELCADLGLDTPSILHAPFSFLAKALEEIVDLKDDGKFKVLGQRLDLVKEWAAAAISEYELGEKTPKKEAEAVDRSMQMRLFEMIVHGEFEGLDEIAEKARKGDGWEEAELLAGAYNSWGAALDAMARDETGEAADALWQQACAKYAEAVRIRPDMHEAWYNWGLGLTELAKAKTGESADALWEQACAKYAEAVRIKPDKHEAWNNWGIALDDMAQAKTGEVADALWQEACAKYAEAIRIKPDKHESWYNWGNVLDDIAQANTGEAADALLQEACAKYAEAIRIKPDKHEAWSNWGIALDAMARGKTGEAADALWQEAFAKFETALRIKPEDHEAWGNWANALIHLGHAQTDAGAAKALFEEALEKAQMAYSLDRDCYNLACAHALLGHVEPAFEYLEKSLDEGQIDWEHVADDADWNALRSAPTYAALAQRFGGEA